MRTGAISLLTVVIVSIVSLAVLEAMFGKVDNSQVINRDNLFDLVLLNAAVNNSAKPNYVNDSSSSDTHQVSLNTNFESEMDKGIEPTSLSVSGDILSSQPVVKKLIDESESTADIASFVVKSNEKEMIDANKSEKRFVVKEKVIKPG